jgi:hypothetical protein
MKPVWYIPVIPALRRLKHEDLGFEAGLGYIVRPYLKKEEENEEDKEDEEDKKEWGNLRLGKR